MAPTSAESDAPQTICIKPSNAEALPAFLLKGASAIAVAFGTSKPRQNKKVNSKDIKVIKVIKARKYAVSINTETPIKI